MLARPPPSEQRAQRLAGVALGWARGVGVAGAGVAVGAWARGVGVAGAGVLAAGADVGGFVGAAGGLVATAVGVAPPPVAGAAGAGALLATAVGEPEADGLSFDSAPLPTTGAFISTGEGEESLSRYDTALPVWDAYASGNCDGIAESQLTEASVKLNCLIPMSFALRAARKLDYRHDTILAV